VQPVLTRTPLRLGLAGGGTDVPPFATEEGGCVVNCALQLYVYVLAKWRHDGTYRVSYTETEIVEDPADLRHELVREALTVAGVTRGVEVVTVADIPGQGSGLGSSSAVTVGVLHALHALMGERVYPEQLAEEACDVEISRCGKHIGKQDQYAAALGGLNLLSIGPGDGVLVERLRVQESRIRYLEQRLLLYWVQAPPPSGKVLREQAALDRRPLLRDLRNTAEELARDLAGNPYGAVLAAVERGWQAKRSLCDSIGCVEMDLLGGAALEAGAEAVKLCGAGGGGYMLVCAEPERHAAITAALRRQPLPVALDWHGSTIQTGERYGGLERRTA
jgi:D-glycero-alpha-D-manno-heptose-7-phosphate kinase